MLSPGDDKLSRASLTTLLSALRVHLTPTPLLNALPTALQIFAHFQLVSERIKDEARRALKEHEKLLRHLELFGSEEEDLVVMGALTKKEGKRLRSLAERDEGETILAFSLEFRKHHIAIVLSTAKVPLAKARSLIDHYFPDLPLDNPKLRLNHTMLYIRGMRSDQLPTMKAYRDKVLGWYNTGGASDKTETRCPRLEDMVGKGREDMLEVLSRNLLKEAERVVQHVAELETIFPWVAVVENAGSTGEAQLKVLPLFNAVDIEDIEAASKPGAAAKASTKRKIRLRQLSSRSITEHPQSEVQVGSFSNGREDRPASAQHRRLAPRSVRLDSGSSSPSPQKIARLPRVSFDWSKGKAKARISIERRNLTTQHSTSPFRDSAKLDVDSLDEELAALPPPLPSSHFTPTSASPSSARPAKPPASTSEPRSSNSTPGNKKRPRTSSGFPPRCGPDYTVPLPSLGSNVARSKIRPFENSKFIRTGNGVASRAATTAKGKQEDHENSQESGKRDAGFSDETTGKGRSVAFGRQILARR